MKNKGITLVALIITIIVLLILAGITVVSLTGDNGIIKKAQEAKGKTDNASREEQEAINNLLETMNQIQGGNNPPVEQVETEPYLPDETYSYLDGTDLTTGLVCTNGTSEYVWVEVPKSVTSSATTPVQIESALQNYASAYKEKKWTDWTDTWQSGIGIATQAEYDNLKNKVLNSIKIYGGFWIGRYEAGTADNSIRTNDSNPITANAISAQDRYTYNYVTVSQAQELANRNSTSNYSSSLLFGIQWDLTCKYLESKGIAQAKITADSTVIGNYNNVIFTITRGKYSTNDGSTYTNVSGSYKKPDGSILLTTGASERTKTMNIYDLAGNQYEWTLEKASNSGYPCAGRGACYRSNSSFYPLARRDCYDTSESLYCISFRQTLYK